MFHINKFLSCPVLSLHVVPQKTKALCECFGLSRRHKKACPIDILFNFFIFLVVAFTSKKGDNIKYFLTFCNISWATLFIYRHGYARYIYSIHTCIAPYLGKRFFSTLLLLLRLEVA